MQPVEGRRVADVSDGFPNLLGGAVTVHHRDSNGVVLGALDVVQGGARVAVLIDQPDACASRSCFLVKAVTQMFTAHCSPMTDRSHVHPGQRNRTTKTWDRCQHFLLVHKRCDEGGINDRHLRQE